MNKRLKQFLITVAALAFFFAVIYSSDISAEELIDHLKSVSLATLLIYFSFYYISTLSLSFRWGNIVKANFSHINFRLGFFYFYNQLGLFFSAYLLGFLGTLGAKTISLKTKHDISLEDSFCISMLETMCNFTILGIMMIPMLAYFTLGLSVETIFIAQIILIALIFALLIFYSKGFLRLYLKSFEFVLKIIYKFTSKKEQYSKVSQSLEQLQNKKTVLLFLVLTLITYLGAICCYYVLAKGLGFEISILAFFILYPIIYLSTIVPFIPAGLGINEVGWIGFFYLLGIDTQEAMYYAIIKRVVESLSIGVFLFLSYIFFQFSNPSFKTDKLSMSEQ